MFTTFINAFKIKDLRKKILFTLLLLVIYRLGSAIPIPGVDAAAWAKQIEGLALFDFMSLLSGSALSQFTVFAMGISPYITASIIMQLLAIAIPTLEKMSKEEDGRKKIEKITRYVGVGLALVQSFGIIVTYGSNIVTGEPRWWSYVTICVTSAAGTAFLMWLGERITEKGIGNGTSMLIFASIVSRVPEFIVERFRLLFTGVQIWQFFVSLALIVAMITFVVMIEKAERKIPIMYAKRVVGRKMYGGQASYIPIKVKMTGQRQRRTAADLCHDADTGSHHDPAVLLRLRLCHLVGEVHELQRSGARALLSGILCAHHCLRVLLLLHHLQSGGDEQEPAAKRRLYPRHSSG